MVRRFSAPRAAPPTAAQSAIVIDVRQLEFKPRTVALRAGLGSVSAEDGNNRAKKKVSNEAATAAKGRDADRVPAIKPRPAGSEF